MVSISVIGAGYLGAVHATALAYSGFDVVGVDVDADKVRLLNDGRAPFHEPGFDELLAEAIGGGRLRFTTDFVDAAAADLHFLCVGTPQSAEGAAADLSYVWAAVEALSAVARPDSVVVGKSTVPVGTASAIQTALLADHGPRGPVVLWNPEFLREGFAVQDTLAPDRIVVGLPDTGSASAAAAARTLREVYSTQIESGVPYLETDLATAELVKVAANAFLATKISFINAMAEICEAVSADVVQLADAIGHDARIGRRFLNAGVGFGGGCLPKDIRAFGARAKKLGLADAVGVLEWADNVNLRRRSSAVQSALEFLGGSPLGRRVAILGAAFKPDSDDVRDSPGLWIGAELARAGADVVVHDPKARHTAERSHGHLQHADSVEQALAGAEVVVLATEWNHYRELDPQYAGRLVRTRRIVDGRNALDAQAWTEAGWQYRGMGRSRAAADDPVVDLRSDREAEVSL